MSKHIVMIEDEKHIANNYRDSLTQKGYKVSIYHDKPSAMAALSGELPDLVLVDIGLGDDEDAGFDICNQLRSRSETLPIVFLTARDTETDQICGTRFGADEYQIKSTPMHMVLLRIQALLRRVEAYKNAKEAQGEVAHGRLTVNADCMKAKWQGELINLSVTEFWLVKSLTDRIGHVKTKDALREAATLYCEDNTIATHIRRIRLKFKEIDPEFHQIDTVAATGYRWLAEA